MVRKLTDDTVEVVAREMAAIVVRGDNEERAARQRHIEDVARDLRAEFRREVSELREEVGELVAEVHKLIEAEKATRLEQDVRIQAILLNRTDQSV
jgi:polyhydroxyalkanoate synthesis regulator phasin